VRDSKGAPVDQSTLKRAAEIEVAFRNMARHCDGDAHIPKRRVYQDGDRGGPAQTQNPLEEKRKTDLTLTGLLMEGLGTAY
jgi:hypothetical protein